MLTDHTNVMVKKKDCQIRHLPLDKSHFITEKRTPNVAHTLSLCRILDIKLEELEEETEKRQIKEVVDGDSVSIYSAD